MLNPKVAPLLAMLEPLNTQIELLDEKLGELARKDERVKRLMTMPEVGPVTAVAFGVLYAMWRDGSPYDPARLGNAQVAKAERAA